jgi:chromosome segregation ATPase
MMSDRHDIVVRLRTINTGYNDVQYLLNEAATEIKRLRHAIATIAMQPLTADEAERLRAALIDRVGRTMSYPLEILDAMLRDDSNYPMATKDQVRQIRDEIERLRTARDECESQFQKAITTIGGLEDEVRRLRTVIAAYKARDQRWCYAKKRAALTDRTEP